MVIYNRNRYLVTFVTCFFILGSNSIGVIASQVGEISIKNQSEFVFTLIDELPVSLEDLFSLDNFTAFEEILDIIENSYTPFWPIKPFGTFFGHGHHEGLARMDLNPYKHHVEIRAPIDGIVKFYLTMNNTVDLVNGVECIMDCSLGIDIGNECWLSLGHIDMLKTIWDELESTGTYSFAKGELIGFTYSVNEGPASIVDFMYYYKSVIIPPHLAFTPKLLGEVEVLFNFQYERAKLNGLYPRARMINDMFIHKDDEFWGNWYYKTGPFDSYVDPEEHISAYDFGVLTFMNREFTTPETCWKNTLNHSKNLTDDILGLGRGVWEATTPGFMGISDGYIRLAEGDNTSGIFSYQTYYDSDYGPANTTLFGKFDMIVNSTSIIDDELQIEFFPTLVEAQSGFTENVSTYYRIYNPTLDDIELPEPTTTPNTNNSTIFIFPALLSLIITSILIRKKRNE